MRLQAIAITELSLGCTYLADSRSLRFNDISNDADMTSLFHSPAVVLVVVSVIVFFVAMLGCYVFYRMKRAFLMIVSQSIPSPINNHQWRDLWGSWGPDLPLSGSGEGPDVHGSPHGNDFSVGEQELNDFSVGEAKIGEKQSIQSNSKYNFM